MELRIAVARQIILMMRHWWTVITVKNVLCAIQTNVMDIHWIQKFRLKNV